jgi:hypothetical protein
MRLANMARGVVLQMSDTQLSWVNDQITRSK